MAIFSSDVELASYQQVQELAENLHVLISEIRKIGKVGSDEILSNQEVCDMLKISKRNLQTLRDEQRIAFIQNKVGGIIRYRKSDILKFIENNIVPVSPK